MNNFTMIEDENALSVDERKRILRKRMKKRRAENENRDSKAVLMTENLLSVLPETVKKVFVYLSFSSEADTDFLIEKLIERGIEIFCPRVEGKYMVAAAYSSELCLSELGIREPTGEAYTGSIDAVVLPLLAVDKKGNRLGYGGGYYDRFLQDYPSALKIAFCYDFQVVEEVPKKEWDIPAEYIVTDKRVLRVEK
jgi:5-formyltetrahydrofolate cyclo-ligase